MTREELIALIRKKQSFLCIGLDTDMEKIPPCLMNEEDPVFSFNKRIIDATIDRAVAYKPNLAFYEARGAQGWQCLVKTIDYLKRHPGGPVLTIADAKRGDIGNTAKQYARAFFEEMDVDGITVNPYMGRDSVEPFISYKHKWTIVLALTSNPGGGDFQLLSTTQDPPQSLSAGEKTMPLYARVVQQCMQIGTAGQMMFVVGATRPAMLRSLRNMAPDHFFLIPGVGAQGGKLTEVAMEAMNQDVGLLINSSRGIIYASSEEDFDVRAGEAAADLQTQMKELLQGI